MDFLNHIEKAQPEIISTLQELIAIPSVKAEPAGADAPFGREIARALEYVLAWGERQGFTAKNLSGYAGHLEYGTGEKTVGVLVHLDVVPAGEGWRYSPFSGTVADGKIYGRGAIDDKGPAVAVMYALKALKESGVKLGKKIRIIFGCDEESGWRCMEHYFKHERKPDYGFTPDAYFPLINSEKGQMALKFESEVASDGTGVILKTFTGGTRRNVVPEEAEAVLAFPDQEGLEKGKAALLAQGIDGIEVLALPEQNHLKVRAQGVPAHGSTPELGDNAVTKLAQALAPLEGEGSAWAAVRFIRERIGRQTDGRGLGINCQDEVSGALTINLGVVRTEAGKIRMEVDIRSPQSADHETLKEKIADHLRPYGLKIAEYSTMPPHYLPVDHHLVQVLLQVYREETGDWSKPVATGGRTYAVALGNGVAFGPGFPGQPETAHQKDEYIAVADLMKCTRIYAKALYALAKEE
ncbi:MAG TPA: dipeptidase PepV [Firmicutes bacterium]|uniref:Dipeptidase PepV n=1 Tax=Capillibacterium thermochitinicola TaxID=2699427 RepID=A0A8J6I205_9FIRM|nr:dipeptidase PepV [Capillibacterium thermochitinicola]HHW12185.1 dipeptidase PepV [Bacillota bacterium]